jgi:microcystin-dependent protein
MGIKLTLNPTNAQTPVGMVIAMATPTVPAGYLECNGAAVSRTVYRTLFGLIGTSYGAGDSSTTFNLPNLRGAFVRGHDNGRGIDSGRTFGTTQASGSGHTHSPGAGAGTSGSTAINASQGFPYNVAMRYVIKY